MKQKAQYVRYEELNFSQRVEGFKYLISNQKIIDKHSLCYFLRMIDSHKFMYAEEYKRDILLQKLSALIQLRENYDRCVCSEWTKQQVLNKYNQFN